MNKLETKMYRLNVKVTEEAAGLLKAEAARLGTSMGTIVTILALDKKKENEVIKLTNIYEREQQKALNKS